jgi:hypothetical protein
MIRRVLLTLGNYQDIIILCHPTDKILITGHKSTTFRYRWQNLPAAASNIGAPLANNYFFSLPAGVGPGHSWLAEFANVSGGGGRMTPRESAETRSR